MLDINSSIEGAGQIYNDLSLRSWNAGTSSLTSVISAYPNPGYSFIGWQNPNNKSLLQVKAQQFSQLIQMRP